MQDDLPFEGVKVLDLSQGVAGPYCGMHLARNGADVIKAEPPGSGCWSRQLGKWTGDHTAHSVIVNRAKRSLAVDLKTDEGAAIVQRLASVPGVQAAAFTSAQDGLPLDGDGLLLPAAQPAGPAADPGERRVSLR